MFYNLLIMNSSLVIFSQPLKWDKAEESIQKFREEYIITSIVNTEIQEKSMLKWLPVLHIHDYEMYSVSPEIIDKDLLKEKHSQVRHLFTEPV